MKLEPLKKRRDFLAASSHGRSWVTPAFVIQLRERTEEENISSKNPRVGYTASRKVGNAVKRNRAKRRMREAVKQICPNYSLVGHDLVFILRSDILSYDFSKIKDDIKWALKRLEVGKSDQ